MTIKKLLLATCILTGTLSAENTLAININKNDVELLGSVNINSLTGYADGTEYILNASHLHVDGDNLTTVGVVGQNSFQGIYGMTLAFGAKMVFTDNFTALPLIAKGTYALPFTDSVPTTSLSLTFAYAPPVLTFLDGQDYSEFRIEANMEVISNIHLFTGYRNIDTDYKTGDKNFNSSFYGGLKLSF